MSRTPSNAIDMMLPGGGEMGALMREANWERLPVGPVEQWPAELLEAVRLMLNTRLPCCVAWGREQFFFYNDAFRSILGETKCAYPLGCTARELWPEIWDVMGPLTEGVLETGVPAYLEDTLFFIERNSPAEEMYATVSLAPILDEHREVLGLFATVVETTASILSRRRLQLHRDLTMRLSEVYDVESITKETFRLLEEHPEDIPFAVCALLQDGKLARDSLSSCRAGLPAELEPDAVADILLQEWPSARVLAAKRMEVVELEGSSLWELASRAWPRKAERMALYPLMANDDPHPLGLLGLGISPHIKFDSDYGEFMRLIVRQYAAALEHTRAHEIERRQREEQLRRAEQLSLVMTLHMSLEGHFVKVPPAFCEMLGYTEDELLGRHFASVTYPEDVEADQALRDRLLRREIDTFDLEKRYMRKDCALVWVYLNVAAVRDRHGETLYLLVYVRDITAQKQMELALRDSQRQLQTIIDTAPVSVVYIDQDWRYQFVNHAYCDLNGVTRQEIVGKHLREVLPAEIYDRVATYVELSFAGEDVSYDIVRPTRLGPRSMHVEFGRDCDERGEVRGLIAVLSDVTEQVAVLNALRASERSLSRAQRIAKMGSWEVSSDLRQARWSEQLYRLFGMEPFSLAPAYDAAMRFVHPDDRATLVAGLQAALNERRLSTVEHRIVRRDGAERWVLTHIEPMQEPGGAVRLAGTSLDITDRRAAEELLREKTEELARSNAELQSFAYVVSHDLQEPLRMVASYVGLLKQRYAGKLDADADDFIQFAVEGAERMQRLILDLLAYSRVGRPGSTERAVDLSEVMSSAVANLQRVIEDTDAVITSEPLPVVWAVESQMAQLFQNLLGNALKFRREESPQIHVGAEERNDHWLLWVRDNGIGIPPQHKERVFQVFHRLHARDAYPGTGIGLAICKRIVEREGGRIWLESTPGHGTTFYFTLRKREAREAGR